MSNKLASPIKRTVAIVNGTAVKGTMTKNGQAVPLTPPPKPAGGKP